jgi:uncharacterized membrane protein YhaH (DUF805 family)
VFRGAETGAAYQEGEMTTERMTGSGPQMSARARRYLETHVDKVAPPPPAAPARRPAASGGLYHHAPARGFLEAVAVCLAKFATFSGRASRSEYWYFMLFQFLASLAAAVVDVGYFGVSLSGDQTGPAGTVTTLVLLLPFLAVSWRRLHDIGRSGWWIGGFWLVLFGWGVLTALTLVAGQGVAAALGQTLLVGAGSLIYALVMLVFLCTRGDPGPNRFG